MGEVAVGRDRGNYLHIYFLIFGKSVHIYQLHDTLFLKVTVISHKDYQRLMRFSTLSTLFF